MTFLLVGGSIAGFLIQTRPEAEQQTPEEPKTFVRARVAEPMSHRVKVPVMGVVRAEREVLLQPEITGRVLEQSEYLVDGGVVQEGEVLIRVDARDYASALTMSKAELARARLQVREEKVQRKVAEAEWRDAPEIAEDSREYVMREPHLDVARAQVSSARTRIQKSKRDLGRAFIRAPFDAVVVSEDVEVGQLVGPQSPLARLAGVERFWIQASIPVSQLPFLDIPRVNTEGRQGSSAVVIDRAAGEVSRDGYVLRLLPTVEERGRMAQIAIAVDDPMGLTRPVAERTTPLLIGTYVEAEIFGRTLEDVVEVPRRAMLDDAHVWVVDSELRLHAREVSVAWRERGRVFVQRGLEAGERFVVNNLPMATDGMKVELLEDEEPPAEASDTDPVPLNFEGVPSPSE